MQVMLNIFYILSQKSRFVFAGGGSTPLIADMSAKKSSFFYTLLKRKGGGLKGGEILFLFIKGKNGQKKIRYKYGSTLKSHHLNH